MKRAAPLLLGVALEMEGREGRQGVGCWSHRALVESVSLFQ